jgi:GTPase involved in cell partitioning and DNA repair
VFVKGGSGGQGSASFKTVNGRQKGAADGGSGGGGGDVIFLCDFKMNTLQVRGLRSVCRGREAEVGGDWPVRR